MATPEASAEYLARVNFKPLMEWLTARCILHRPDDPLAYCAKLLQAKIGSRSGDSYDPRAASMYLTQCYDEAMTQADEHGIIWATADKTKAPRGSINEPAPEDEQPKASTVKEAPTPTVAAQTTAASAPESEAPPRRVSDRAAPVTVAAAAAPDADSVSIDGFFLPLVSAFADGAEACSRELMAKGILACACKIFNADQAVLYGHQGSSELEMNPGGSLRGSISSRASLTPRPLLQLGTDFGTERKTVPRGGGGSLLATAAHPPFVTRVIPDTAAAGSGFTAGIDELSPDAPTASMLVGPLVQQGVGGGSLGASLVGVLALGRKAGGNAFKPTDEAAFKAFSALAAAMLRHAARYELKEKECTKFRSMVEIIEATNQQDSMGVNHILYTISSCLPRVCDAHKCTTFIVDEDHEELWAIQGEINIRMPKDKGIAGAVVTSGKAINIPDAYHDPRFNQQVDHDTGYITQTILAVPIRAQDGKVLGVVQLINKSEMGDIHAGVFSKQDEEILNAFLGTLAPLLQSSKLFRSLEVKTPRGSKEEGEFVGRTPLGAAMMGSSSASLRGDGSLRNTMKAEIAEGEEGEEDNEEEDGSDAMLEFDENIK